MSSMRPKVYLETSVPSYLISRPSRDLIVAAHQEVTREWWLSRRRDFALFVSQFVISECSAGDEDLARQRLRALRDIPSLEVIDEVSGLANSLIAEGVIPQKSAADAAHVAVATVHRMDFLLTWNCSHIANARIITRIRDVCRSDRYVCPVICTPEELMED